MDSLTIIFVAMAAIFFGYGGYVLGNFYPLIKTKKKLDKKPVVVKQVVKSEIDEDQESESVEMEKRVIPLNLDPDETMQIWYDAKARTIIPEIEGELLNLDDEVSDEDKQKLTWLLIDLQEKVGLMSSVIKRRDESKEMIKPGEDLAKSGFNPLKSFKDYLQSDIPKIKENEDSMPEQINNILQQQITGTTLEDKGIQMIERPDVGLVFMIGIDLYEDIDKIPNKKIQNAIKKAVKTWENNLKLSD